MWCRVPQRCLVGVDPAASGLLFLVARHARPSLSSPTFCLPAGPAHHCFACASCMPRSLHSGANFAPKLGLFVGCHHQRQSISARSHMHAAALRLKSRLALAVSVPPVPSLFPLQLFGAPGGAGGAGGGGSGGGGEKRRRRRKKADGDAVFAVASFASPGGGNVAAASGIATAAAPTAADARSPLPAPSDLTSEAAHVFNRRATCRTVFPALTQRFEPKSLGAVVDVSGASAGAERAARAKLSWRTLAFMFGLSFCTCVLCVSLAPAHLIRWDASPLPDEAHGAATGTAVSVRRLVTREDVWMAAPLAAALPLFRDSGVCAEERYTYRLGVGTAARPSYGKDMLLVSDRYQFVCVVIWKVASRTLLKALEGPLEGGGLGAVRVEGHRLTPQQRGYTTFTFVRDPLARFVSGYFSAMKWTKMKRHALCAKKLAEVHAASADAPPNGAATCDDKGQKSGGGSDGGGGGGGGGGDDPDGCSGGSGGDDLSFLHDGDIDQSAEMAGHPGEPARFLRFTRRLVGSGQGTGVAFPGVQHVFTQASFLSVTDAAGEPLFPRLDFIGPCNRDARAVSLLGGAVGVDVGCSVLVFVVCGVHGRFDSGSQPKCATDSDHALSHTSPGRPELCGGGIARAFFVAPVSLHALHRPHRPRPSRQAGAFRGRLAAARGSPRHAAARPSAPAAAPHPAPQPDAGRALGAAPGSARQPHGTSQAGLRLLHAGLHVLRLQEPARLRAAAQDGKEVVLSREGQCLRISSRRLSSLRGRAYGGACRWCFRGYHINAA